ncbi:MAG: radical SAM protein [Blastocatellia bacterium AA13]|nr:MAG: radical SAM protein [Blastocatellia bacterium AA13]
MMAQPAESILLISCYELGHQPMGLALPLGMLKREGISAETMDVSVEGFDAKKAARARFVGISVPMHTALRLGVKVAEEIRKINTRCHICFYGLYASLNSDYLLAGIADSVIGGEYEEALVSLIKHSIERIESNSENSVEGVAAIGSAGAPILKRLKFDTPQRRSLVPLEKYAGLEIGGERRLAGYTEASRGCLHLCTHCPIPPVYKGRFFVVPAEIVMEDIRSLAALGARHITFGDPDFLNGPGHSLKVARMLHDEFPELTFDFTAKVEHLLKHGSLLGEFAELGCLFLVSAFESTSDSVLTHLEKGHTYDDMKEAVGLVREAGISLRPTWVAFTPWTTNDDYIEMLEFIASEGLIGNVDPVQYAIRLLAPPGSLLLASPESKQWLGPLSESDFSYQWQHPDPAMDELHGRVTSLVARDAARGDEPAATFTRVRELAYGAGSRLNFFPRHLALATVNLRPPKLTEAWFC